MFKKLIKTIQLVENCACVTRTILYSAFPHYFFDYRTRLLDKYTKLEETLIFNDAMNITGFIH